MSDDRFEQIETKLAHQEHTLMELNDALAHQQNSIMTLERLCNSLADRIKSMSESQGSGSDIDEPPPHY